MDKKNIAIITFASGEPYLSESKNLEYLCSLYEIEFIRYDINFLKSTGFYDKNKTLLDMPKTGYCCWKPYIILDALKKYDKVLYLDSSNLFTTKENLDAFLLNDGIVSTRTALNNGDHTKIESFHIMNIDYEKYKNDFQPWAGVVLSDNSYFAKNILNEWLYYNLIPECIMPNKNSGLMGHLYDQSILGLLFSKFGLNSLDNNAFLDIRDMSHLQCVCNLYGTNMIVEQANLFIKYEQVYETSGSFGWHFSENGKVTDGVSLVLKQIEFAR